MTKKEKIETIRKVSGMIDQAIEEMLSVEVKGLSYQAQWMVNQNLEAAGAATSMLLELETGSKTKASRKKGGSK